LNFVNILGAIVLSNVLVESKDQPVQALAGSSGGQVGSNESGLGLIANLTGALGGGAGELTEFVERIKEGGGGSKGNVELQTQSGGNQGGLNGGIVANLMTGKGAGSGLGKLLSDAVSLNIASQSQTSAISTEQNEHARVLLVSMFQASKSQKGQSNINLEKLADDYSGIGAEESNFIRTEIERTDDLNTLVAHIPPGFEQQVYVMSALSVNLDSGAALSYLEALSQRLAISAQEVENIHTELGLPLINQTTLGSSPA